MIRAEEKLSNKVCADLTGQRLRQLKRFSNRMLLGGIIMHLKVISLSCAGFGCVRACSL